MNHERIHAQANELAKKCDKFATKMATSLLDFLEAHDLMQPLKQNGLNQLIFMGVAAVFQLREWERMGILAHMPFHATGYELICQHATELSARHNIEYLKSMALFLDVCRYYLAHFACPGAFPETPGYYRTAHSANQSALWKNTVMAELNPNRFALPPATSASTEDTAAAGKKPLSISGVEGTWSRRQAASYCGVSISTLKRMHTAGEIPPTLYRQRSKGGGIRYFPKAFMAWFENWSKK